jgi:hypothetical protein
MKKIKLLLFLGVLLTSFNVIHEYYLSTTTLKLVPAKQQLQITSRFFLEDIEALMQEKTDQKVAFLPDSNPAEIDAFVKEFYLNNLTIASDGAQQQIDYLGREYQDDLLVVYAEVVLHSNESKRLEVKATFLTDFLSGQQNIIHLSSPAQKKSFLLTHKKTAFGFTLR